jgi:hypothetical protein
MSPEVGSIREWAGSDNKKTSLKSPRLQISRNSDSGLFFADTSHHFLHWWPVEEEQHMS